MRNYDINQTWEGDNNILLQQTGKYLLDILKKKMKGKLEKPTITCEWIKIDPVQGEKCLAQTPEEFLTFESLQHIFEFRANLLL